MPRFNSKKCVTCGTVTSVFIPLEPSRNYRLVPGKHGMDQMVSADTGVEYVYQNGRLLMPCRGCGRLRSTSRVIGVIRSDRPCNAKCLGATGHHCECACGGKNHGAGFEA